MNPGKMNPGKMDLGKMEPDMIDSGVARSQLSSILGLQHLFSHILLIICTSRPSVSE